MPMNTKSQSSGGKAQLAARKLRRCGDFVKSPGNDFSRGGQKASRDKCVIPWKTPKKFREMLLLNGNCVLDPCACLPSTARRAVRVWRGCACAPGVRAEQTGLLRVWKRFHHLEVLQPLAETFGVTFCEWCSSLKAFPSGRSGARRGAARVWGWRCPAPAPREGGPLSSGCGTLAPGAFRFSSHSLRPCSLLSGSCFLYSFCDL